MKCVACGTREATHLGLLCTRCFRHVRTVIAHRQGNRLRTYHLTPERYAEMMAEQDGKCKCCREDFGFKRICVDHDHSCCPAGGSCGKCIRGLLCARCNVMVGYWEQFNGDAGKAITEYLRVPMFQGGD